jgi:hypothetical protein
VKLDVVIADGNESAVDFLGKEIDEPFGRDTALGGLLSRAGCVEIPKGVIIDCWPDFRAPVFDHAIALNP